MLRAGHAAVTATGATSNLRERLCALDGSSENIRGLVDEIAGCRACAEAFAATPSAHAPRPVLQIAPRARLCLAGQAPGVQAHVKGRPFDDPSGQRLRRWLGLAEAAFYDAEKLAILPMGFCFPGQNAKGADLPPARACAALWRERLMAAHPRLELILILGKHALDWHLGPRRYPTLTAAAADWRARLNAPERPRAVALPHPSWRNNAWLKRNPWFEDEAAPALRAAVAELI